VSGRAPLVGQGRKAATFKAARKGRAARIRRHPTPYNIVKRGSKFCVISTDSGKTHGCHPTKADARQQQKAMYVHANPKKEKKEK